MVQPRANLSDIVRIWWAIAWRAGSGALIFSLALYVPVPVALARIWALLIDALMILSTLVAAHLVLDRRIGSVKLAFRDESLAQVKAEKRWLQTLHLWAGLLGRGFFFQMPIILIFWPLFLPILCFLLLFVPIPFWVRLCSTANQGSLLVQLKLLNMDVHFVWFALELFWLPALWMMIGRRFGSARLVIERVSGG